MLFGFLIDVVGTVGQACVMMVEQLHVAMLPTTIFGLLCLVVSFMHAAAELGSHPAGM